MVFECVAPSISEADQQYEKATGINPEKQMYVGCSLEKVHYPEGLTEKDIALINEQCEFQSALALEQIEGFARAYKIAKEEIADVDRFRSYDAKKIEELILHLAEVIEKRNEKGYRQTPAVFRDGSSGIDWQSIPRSVQVFCEAFAEKRMEPLEAYKRFEEIHPFEDGNGRVGDLLWKMAMTEKTGKWPEELPPDIFSFRS